MKYISAIAICTLLFIVSGADCYEASFSIKDARSTATVYDDMNADPSASVSGVATATSGPGGIGIAGSMTTKALAGPIEEHHSFTTTTGETASVNALASEAQGYEYTWNYAIGDHYVNVWQDLSITLGENIDLNASASNPEGDAAWVSLKTAYGSISGYHGEGTATNERASAYQKWMSADVLNENDLRLDWSASNLKGDKANGYAVFKSPTGDISSEKVPSSMDAIAAIDYASAKLDLGNLNSGECFSVFSEASNKMSLQRQSISGGSFGNLRVKVSSTAESKKIKNSILVKKGK